MTWEEMEMDVDEFERQRLLANRELDQLCELYPDEEDQKEAVVQWVLSKSPITGEYKPL